MKREIVKIDRELCNGCGNCIPNCHEGALQMIDDKATLVSELMCDGLGACIGHCPVGAITIEMREAQPYDEVATLKEMIPNGKNVIIAHLKHLKDHDQFEFLKQGVTFLKSIEGTTPFDINEIISTVHNHKPQQQKNNQQHHTNMKHDNHQEFCGCPGSKEMSFKNNLVIDQQQVQQNVQSELRQWPVQLHLINPMASYFKSADLLVAADCVAFSLGNFHQNYLKGKSLVIACPKLDSGKEIYIEKLTRLIEEAKVNTINVMIMEVPCCFGLLQMVQIAQQQAKRKVPIKQTTVGVQGEIVSEEWV